MVIWVWVSNGVMCWMLWRDKRAVGTLTDHGVLVYVEMSLECCCVGFLVG